MMERKIEQPAIGIKEEKTEKEESNIRATAGGEGGRAGSTCLQ
jgi:hypothetical protein